MSATRALSVRGLAKRFGALVVAQAIDLDLAPGARVALIGPNGAGKTTFVNLLTGFLEPVMAGSNCAGRACGDCARSSGSGAGWCGRIR